MNSIYSKGKALLVGAAIASILAGCASAPKTNAELDQARVAVQRVETMPEAGKYAADEVTAAHEALRKAEQLADDKKSQKAISDAAYIAQRHADTAEQQISRGQAEAATQKAEQERQRVLLQAREQEAAARQREAAARELEAQAAKAQAEQDKAKAEQAAQMARADAEALQQQLRDLQARQTDRGLVLTLGDVLFDSGQATLKPGAQSTIQRLAEFLRKSPDRSVVIEGHTDSVGSDALNQTLSENRANAVRAALVAQGIDMTRILAMGKGESTPVASNDDTAGRQQNRRVEIIISNPVEVAARP